MHAEDLVYTVGGFLQPERMLPAPIDARARVKLTAALSRWIVDHRLIDKHEHSCALLDLGYELRQARIRQWSVTT